MTQQNLPAEIAAFITTYRQDHRNHQKMLDETFRGRPRLLAWLHAHAVHNPFMTQGLVEALAKHAIGDFDPDGLPTKAGGHPVKVDDHGTYNPPPRGAGGIKLTPELERSAAKARAEFEAKNGTGAGNDDTKPPSAWDRLSERSATERRM